MLIWMKLLSVIYINIVIVIVKQAVKRVSWRLSE